MAELWSQLELPRPWWLVGLAMLPLLVYYSRRSLSRFSRTRQAASLAARAFLTVLLVLALTGVRISRPTSEKLIVFAIDRSGSIADQSHNLIAEYLHEASAAAAGKGGYALLPFAARPLPAAGDLSALDVKVDRGGTDLAAAIQSAAAAFPPDRVPEIVLMTDGNATSGDALAAARAHSVPVSVKPLPSRADPEVYVAGVHGPGNVQDGEPFHVDVLVHSRSGGTGTVKLLCDGQHADERPVALTEGENRVRFVQSVAGRPVATFKAIAEGFRDTVSENNSATAIVFTTPQPKVMLVESEPRMAEPFAAALEGQRIGVDVRRPEEMPVSLDELAGYELLCLSNVPARAISEQQMEVIESYVRDLGGGLIAIGGEQAFTPGGYRHTRLEKVLPVRSEFEKKPVRPSLAMVFLVDCSGSMQGSPIALAKDATRRAVAMLEPSDQVGVVGFENTSNWVSPLRPASDRQVLLRGIDSMEAGGGTDLYSAMDKAALALEEAFAERKHMIVLTDGVSHPGDFDGLVEEIAAAGITVSTVGVGDEAAGELLQSIANHGDGHYYSCDDPADVPQVFALETATASRMGIIEQPFSPRVADAAAMLDELGLEDAPSLLGYVETKPKPASRLVLSSESGDPLLIWWRYGLGISVAFTSDIQSRWATAWLQWPGFGPFWSRIVRHAMRKDEARDFLLRIARDGTSANVSIDAIGPEGTFLNRAVATMTVIDPGRRRHEWPVPQVAPGRYAARFATPCAGPYFLEVRLENEGRLVYARRRGLTVDYADEYRTRPVNHQLLMQIAEATGGKYDPDPRDLFLSPRRTVRRTILLWPYLLMAATVIFALDVTVRRTAGS